MAEKVAQLPSRIAANVRARVDGWMNILSGKGTARDTRLSSRFVIAKALDHKQLDDMYRASGVCRRVVDALPELVTREPWTVPGDPQGLLWQYLDRLECNAAVREALQWARLYGGAIVVLGIDDARAFDQPVNMAGVRTLDFIRVYDRYQIGTSATDWDTDPKSPRFGKRTWYTINPATSGAGATVTQYRAHWTRVLTVDGMPVPSRARVQNQGWGDSILEVVHEEVERFCDGLDDCGLMLRDFVQGALTVKGLTSILASEGGEDLVKARLDILDLSRHILNTMVLDEGETYTKHASSVAGVGEILDRLMAAVSTAVNIPQAILFGRAPAGMNATGESDTRAFYDSGAAFQRERVRPMWMRLAAIAMAAKDGPASKLGSAVNAQAPQIRSAPLWQMSEKERADIRKLTAEADNLYIQNGTLDPEEVATARFGGGDTGAEIRLLTDRTAPPAADPDEDEDPADPADPGTAA